MSTGQHMLLFWTAISGVGTGLGVAAYVIGWLGHGLLDPRRLRLARVLLAGGALLTFLAFLVVWSLLWKQLLLHFGG